MFSVPIRCELVYSQDAKVFIIWVKFVLTLKMHYEIYNCKTTLSGE